MKEPKIRFKGFKGEWEETPFSETFDYLKNNSLSRAELSDGGVVMNIHYGDVLIKYGECVDVSKEVETFVKEEEVAKKLHQSCAIKNGDVIFADAAEDNTVGKCSEIIAKDDDAIISGLHTIPCRPMKQFATRYLGYYLNSDAYHNQLLPHIQGTKISSISKKAISQTHINSPLEKVEQQSIASYFQHLDSLIQSTTKKIESLKQVKAASLQSMFPQEGETTPRVRFKGFEGKWEECLLKDKVNNITTGKLDANAMVPNGKYRFYTCGKEYFKIDKYAFDDEALIISGNGENVGYIHYYNGKFNAYQRTYVLTSFTLNVFYLEHYLKARLSIRINKEKSVANTPYIKMDTISDMNVLYPNDIAEQRAIASYFTSLDRQISLHTQRLEKLKQIKAACLDEMFV